MGVAWYLPDVDVGELAEGKNAEVYGSHDLQKQIRIKCNVAILHGWQNE